MATNAEESETQVEDKPVTDADIAALKAKSLEVEGSDEPDETKEEEETEEQSEEEAADDDKGQTEEVVDSKEEGFKKKFLNIKGETPEEYATQLEVAYDNSTSEALKWKKMYEDAQANRPADETPASDPALTYARQMMDEAMTRDIDNFAKDYPQIRDPEQYAVLEKKVGVLTKAIQAEESRIPSMAEVLSASALILGWEKGSKGEAVGLAVKNEAGVSKTNSQLKTTARTKVTADQIRVAREMDPIKYSGQSDDVIAKDLEPYV